MKGIIDPEKTNEDMIKYMTQPGPFFYGRIGGGETLLAKYFSELKESSKDVNDLLTKIKTYPMISLRMGLMRKYGGYYDVTDNPENILNFCEYYSSLYKNYDAATLAGPDVASYYLHNEFVAPYNDLVEKEKYDKFLTNYFKKDIPLYTYACIESAVYFLKAFKVFAEGKKILVVGPFSKSIQLQKPNLNKLFKDYVYPNFELVTYNTYITYNDSNKPYISLPHNNWFETVDAMCKDISKLDFDIALLGCSSYALPIGSFIKGMGKKAIYMGGIVQVCFGVMGNRWIEESFYVNNKDAFIFPVETDENVMNGKKHHFNKEGFNGYF
ncbi:hypothetical protein ma463 [Moumouvirus australiensis]|uniref:Uncharacterized protein n=1 Tax=Moumouvirus australiensis TaxID=2109587 RepID=A0A2P1ELU1_9VIRU|nr:hypothetical protein QKC55_gp442 [Moumouvirus australiensis]AVL94849.1 hypothetical protein ma463 [Moumouvirus australiensis]